MPLNAKRKNKTKTYKREPGNGEYFVAMMVGGNPRIAIAYKAALAESGIYLKYHWEFLVAKQPPAELDILLMYPDTTIVKRDRTMFAGRARSADVYVINARNTAAVYDALHKEHINGRKLFLNEIERPALKEPEPTPEPEVKLEPEPEPEVKLEPEPEPEPQPQPEPEPAPPIAELQLTTEEFELTPEEPEQQETGTTNLNEEQRRQLRIAGEKVRTARKRTGFTVATLAKQLGMSNGHLYNIERGGTVASNQVLNAIERMLSLEHGTVPRYGTRANRQVATPPDQPRLPPPPPTPAPTVVLSPMQKFNNTLNALQEKCTALNVHQIEFGPEVLIVRRKPGTNLQLLYVQLHELQESAQELNVVVVRLDPTFLSVKRK